MTHLNSEKTRRSLAGARSCRGCRRIFRGAEPRGDSEIPWRVLLGEMMVMSCTVEMKGVWDHRCSLLYIFILWVFWTISSDHTGRITYSLCGDYDSCIISQNIGFSSFLVSLVFTFFFGGNLIDAQIVGTVVMPILPLLDLTCCSGACDAKPVVKLGD